jgi:hypothetical protein
MTGATAARIGTRTGAGRLGRSGKCTDVAGPAHCSRGARWMATFRSDSAGAAVVICTWVSPIRTYDPICAVAGWWADNGSPSSVVPLADPRSVSTISVESTEMSSCRRLMELSAIASPSSRSRPITWSPIGSASRRPASGPDTNRSSIRAGGGGSIAAPMRTITPSRSAQSDPLPSAATGRPSMVSMASGSAPTVARSAASKGAAGAASDAVTRTSAAVPVAVATTVIVTSITGR